MPIKTFINGQENGVITFKDDTEPCSVYVNGEKQDLISYYPREVSGENSVQYASEYKNNIRTLSIEGNTVQETYQGVNLFNINAPLLASPFSIEKTAKPKIENGIIYSGGYNEATHGCFLFVATNGDGDYTFSFDATCGAIESGMCYRIVGTAEVDGATNETGPWDDIDSTDITGNGKYTITVDNNGYEYIGIAFYSPTRYNIAVTNLQIEKGSVTASSVPSIEHPLKISSPGNSQVDITLETRGENLFNIDNPFIVYPSQYAINQNLTPKIENGVIYSGGVGSSYGAFLCVETDKKSVYTISFDANFDETTQIRTRCSIAKFNGISNGIMSDSTISEKTIVKGKNVFDTYADGYRYVGVAFHSNTKYGMEITNLTIENTISDIVLDCDVSKIKAATNPATDKIYISDVNVENKSLTITTPVDIPINDIGYMGTGARFNALFPSAEVGKKYLLKFKNSLMGYCRNAMFLTGANPNKTWGNNTVETLTQGMFDASVVLYGYDISAHKNTDPLPLPANAVISDITLTEVLEPIKTTVSIPANVVLESGANDTLLELAKIGDIADTITIDRVNNEVKYTQRICRVRPFVNVGGRLEFDGSASGNPDAWFFLPNKNAQAGIGKCEFSPITNDIVGENEFGVIIYDTLIIIDTPKSLGLNSPEALANYVSQNNADGLSIFYALEEPIEWTVDSISDTELKAQFEDLSNRLLDWAKNTKNQTNIIEITSTPSVSKTSVNYAKWGGVPNENNT